MSTPQVTLLVLSYMKPVETRRCLESIRAHYIAPHKTVLLDNGGGGSYPSDLYEEELCDVLITKRRGDGGGVGQTDLFRWCDTDYAIFVQSDQEMAVHITADVEARFISMLDHFDVLDLNGDQSGKGIWTDRAHMIKTAFFNSLAPFPNGGPGPRHHDRWNENYLQEVFHNRGNKIAHVSPVFFRDRGVWTIRECAGGVVKMRTDTKAVTWLRRPVERYVFPEMTPDEWDASIAGRWIDGTIPKTYLAREGGSFQCWGDAT